MMENLLLSQRAQEVLKDLKRDDHSYKRQALDEALRLRAELTDSLLEVLKKAASDPMKFLDSGDDSLGYAAILLAHWEEKRAFPIFVQFAQYDDDKLEELWGDMVTQDFQIFLYRTGKNEKAALMELVRDSKAYIYIRVAALGVLNWGIIEGVVSREEMLKFCADVFSDSANQKDSHFTSIVLAEWMDIYPVDFIDLIRSAFAKSKIEPQIVGDLKAVEKELKVGSWEYSLSKLKEEKKRWMHEDIHDYTSWWSVRKEENLEDEEEREAPFRKLENELLKANPLAKLLAKAGVQMSYHEMRAYMLGVVLGLEYVPPSHVIAEVFLQDTDEEAHFQSKKDFLKFYGMFTELWNQLAAWPEKNLPPIFDPSPENLQDPSVLGLALFKRNIEAHWYLIGSFEADTDVDTIKDAKAAEAFRWLSNYSERLDELFKKVSKKGLDFEEKEFLQTQALLLEADKIWPSHYHALQVGLRKQRQNALSNESILADLEDVGPAPFQREEPKISRNDLCPCGSGKKFKKCCLH